MVKLPPTPASIRFVAEALAGSRGGFRDRVSLNDVCALVAGTAEMIAPHFQAWLAGERPDASLSGGEARLLDVIGDLERRLVGAIRDGGASRAPAKAAAGSAPQAPIAANSSARAATDEELRAVVRAALSGAGPETETEIAGSFLTDVWDKAQALRVRRVRTARPPGPRKRRYKPAPRRPDVPKAVRRRGANERLAAVKATAFVGLTLSGGPPGRPARRLSKSDWSGARNLFFARHAAAALRNAGHPMIPSELGDHIAARGGPSVRLSGRDLMAQLAGSPMIRVGPRCLIWFDDETPPLRPKRSRRRDTEEALARELAKRLFAKALVLVRGAGQDGISLKGLRERLGTELGDFNRDWLEQRLKRACADPRSLVRKIPGGYEWTEEASRGHARDRSSKRSGTGSSQRSTMR